MCSYYFSSAVRVVGCCLVARLLLVVLVVPPVFPLVLWCARLGTAAAAAPREEGEEGRGNFGILAS